MMAIQFARKMGAKVIAVSKNERVKDFGADYVINDYGKVVEQVREITQGKMANVVLNSVGVEAWRCSFDSVGVNGRLVTFGALTGADLKINIQSLYLRQVKLIGSTGGTRKQLKDFLICLMNSKLRYGNDSNLKKPKSLYGHCLLRKEMVEF